MTAVLYARISSREQEKGFSIEAQLKLLRDYARQKKLDIGEEFIDIESAKTQGRTEFGRMIKAARGKAPVILVEKTDRLYRNIKDWLTLDDLQAEIHFVKENQILSPRSHSSEKFMHGIKVLMAKLYIENLAEETIKGHIEALIQGYSTGSAPPYGYRAQHDDNSTRAKWIPDPETAPIVQKIFDLRAQGCSLERIAQVLDEAGMKPPRGKKWRSNTIHHFFKNPAYIGWKMYRTAHNPYGKSYWQGQPDYIAVEGEFIINMQAHPAIIEGQVWSMVQEKRIYQVKKGRKDHRPLSGLVYCALCGSRLHYISPRKDKVYLQCSGRKNHICDAPSIDGNELLQAVIAELSQEIESLDPAEVLINEEPEEAPGDEAQEITARLRVINEELDRCNEAVVKGFEYESLIPKVKELTEERRSLQEKARRLRLSVAEKLPEADKLKALFTQWAKDIKILQGDELREVLNLTIQRIEVSGENVEISYIPPFVRIRWLRGLELNRFLRRVEFLIR